MIFQNFFQQHQQEFNDILFQNRNKEYGAYQLRKNYYHNLNKSLVISTSLTVLMFLLCFFLNKHEQQQAINTYSNTNKDAYRMEQVKVIQPKSAAAFMKKTFTNMIYAVTKDSMVNDKDTTTKAAFRQSLARTAAGSDSSHGFDSTNVRRIVQDHKPTIDSSSIIHIMPGVMPEFPGGSASLMQYLSDNINCSMWNQHGLQGGKVIVSMVIMQDGTVDQIKVLRDEIGFQCTDNIIQVINKMPRWKPGMQGKRAVNVRYILPVYFEK